MRTNRHHSSKTCWTSGYLTSGCSLIGYILSGYLAIVSPVSGCLVNSHLRVPNRSSSRSVFAVPPTLLLRPPWRHSRPCTTRWATSRRHTHQRPPRDICQVWCFIIVLTQLHTRTRAVLIHVCTCTVTVYVHVHVHVDTIHLVHVVYIPYASWVQMCYIQFMYFSITTESNTLVCAHCTDLL